MRERINHMLSAVYDYPLTIVEAPIGFGKTTAVRDFLAHEKVRTLWITFQNSSEASALFWEKLSDEIGKIDKKSGKALGSLGLPVDAPQTDKVLSILNAIEYEKKTVVVLDDYHLNKNRQINKVIFQIAAERIENFHIVIITRDTTNLNVWELISKSLCEVVSQQILKFTEDEMQEYCRMVMENISESDFKKISEYTDGWISLIHILLLGLEKNIPIGMNMTLDELIKETLFDVYDESIQQFLVNLSIMDSFTAEQAEYVSGNKKAREILKRLHKENSFVFYDEMSKTYKIHNVLLDFLRINRCFEEEELQELYRRLGEWHLMQRTFPKAYSCFYKAGNIECILEHLNNPENIRNELTEFEGSFEMFERAPKEVLYQYPIAYLQHIVVCLIRGDEKMASKCTIHLNDMESFFIDKEDIAPSYKNRVLAEINIIRKLTTFNYIQESAADNDLILKLLNGEQSYIMQQDNEFTFGAPYLTYLYFREQGTLGKTTQLIIDKFVVYSKYANGCGTGSEYLALAEYALETGDFQSAELNSQKAIYKAKTKSQHSVMICAQFNLIRFYILQGKVEEAINSLRELEEEIREVNNSVYNTTIDLCKGYIYSCLGLTEKIPYWLQTGDMEAADLFYQGVAFNYLVYGKAVAAAKNYIRLEMLSESFEQYFSMYSNQLGFIHNGIFDAIAKYQLYGMEAGTKALRKALAKGEADHIIMPFVENAPHIIEILKAMVINDREDSGYIKSILHYSQRYIESLKSTQLFNVSLTPREKEILSLCANGLTREEIADKLFVSESTVKSHLQKVYQKLDVNRKIAAINIAKENGLI